MVLGGLCVVANAAGSAETALPTCNSSLAMDYGYPPDYAAYRLCACVQS